MTKYDINERSLSIPIDTIRGQSKYGKTSLKPGLLAASYKMEPIVYIYIQVKKECGKLTTQCDVIDCANSFITGSTPVTVTNLFDQYNLKTLTRESIITWHRNFTREKN